MSSELARMQALFHRLVTAPEDVAATMESLGISAESVHATFLGTDRLSAVDRLDVYAGMYFFRLRDVLAEQFEKTAAALGEAAFHNVCVTYLAACPPHTSSVREVGDRLGAFLGTSELISDRPWIAGLAQLEWARLDVFDDADAPVLDAVRVQSTPPEDFGDLPLATVPALRVLDFAHRIDAAWDGEGVESEPVTLLVWRSGRDVFHRALDPLEARTLELVRAGTTFADVCERVAGGVGDEAAAEASFRLLSRWVADCVLKA